MENIRILVLLIGSALILFGYFRLISDEKGHVNLNNYRFTGGIFLVVGGMIEGMRDLIALNLSSNGISTLAICMGALLFFLGFSQ